MSRGVVEGSASYRAPGAAEWVAIALLCGCGVFSALLELLFIGRYYIGTFVVPVVVVAAVVGNLVLTRWGFRILRRMSGATLPLVFWLLPVLALTMYNRPEGDVIVTSLYGQQWVYYGLLFLGAGAGFVTIVMLSGGPAARRPVDPPPARPRPTPGARPPRKSG
jgi:hypothetical protein